MILGSGLGSLVDTLDDAERIDFAALPGFARTTAAGHAGQWVFGDWGGVPVILMSGRLHRYGGWSTAQLTFPIAVMGALGVERLLISNAAGGLHPSLRVGDLVFVEDHIDWLFGTPALRFPRGVEPRPASAAGAHLAGRDRSSLGLPARTVPLYDPELLEAALAAARQADVRAVRGTYLATLGPHYETRAEYRMMRRLGADVVGMSTVPEVVAAARLGLRVLAVSMVSNVARPDCPSKAEHAEVLAAGADAAGPLGAIMQRVISP